MSTLQVLHRDLRRMSVRALLAVLLIPLIVWAFSQYVLARQDADYRAAIEREISAAGASASTHQAEVALLRDNPPSRVCANDDVNAAEHRQRLCDPMGDNWQFYWANKVSLLALVGGGVLLLIVAALGMAAFKGRQAQYRSLVLAWRTLAFASALEVVLQGVMLVWLSFWLTAWFFEIYIIKLVILVCIGVGIAVIAAVVKIFARDPNDFAVDGELVAEADAPTLWARVRALAAQVGTAPPDHLVAGIDNNFFVTESPMALRDQQLRGRSLFISLPLMRVLDQREADAVLAHELAHLRGGDTASSAALGPKLVQFDRYCQEMAGAGLSLIAFYLLSLYRVIFELAWKRDSREREFMADRTAAQTVGSEAVSRSLIKVIAYSAYRSKVEADLFARQERHGDTIGIAAYVAQGLQPFAGSDDFLAAMGAADIPHPFDTHPSLEERMRNVDNVVPAQQFHAVITADVTASWTSQINTADAIEARLWAEYESRFSQAHEFDLAYRYLPRDDAERAIVEKHFPAQVFALKRNESLTVACDGLLLPGEKDLLGWEEVVNIEYTDGFGADILKLQLTEKSLFGNKANSVKLRGIKAQREQLKAALGQYFHRHKVARGEA